MCGGLQGHRGRGPWGGQASRTFCLRPQLASPSSMSAALRGISCYLKEVRHLTGMGTHVGGRRHGPRLTLRLCPAVGAGGAGAGAAGGARPHPAESQLQLAAPGTAGRHLALRPSGCHGRQRLLGPLRQDVSPRPDPLLPREPALARVGPGLSLTPQFLSLHPTSRYLRPDVDKKSKHKTCVKKKTLNPEFNEVPRWGWDAEGGQGGAEEPAHEWVAGLVLRSFSTR